MPKVMSVMLKVMLISVLSAKLVSSVMSVYTIV